MRLVVEQNSALLPKYLRDDPLALWTVVGASVASPTAWSALDNDFGDRELSRSLSEQEHAYASEVARSFFQYAETQDPELRLNFTARVPLSLPDWDEIQTLFRIRAIFERRSSGTLVVWLADNSLTPLLASTGLIGSQRMGRFLSINAGLRIIRAGIRCLLNRSPQVALETRAWFTLGAVLGEQEKDTYYGSWWRNAPGNNLRVFMSPGRGVRLRGCSNQHPLEAFGTLADVLFALLDSLSPPKIARSNHEQAHLDLWNWLARCEWARGDIFTLALQRRIASRLIRRMKDGSIVLPFEGRSWERNITRLAKKFDIHVAGYQHSSLTPRHLALIEPSSSWNPQDYPDRVITCGSITANRLGPLADATGLTIYRGAALRAQRTTLPPPTMSLLVAISSSLGESRAILRLIHAASRDLNVPIVIRPHPSIPIAELYQQYDWPSNVRLSFRSTLTEDMGQVGFIAYSSSTVALEGLIHGRLPIFLDIRDVLVGDPIDNVAFKLNATSPASLVSCIRAVNAWPPEKLDSLRHQGRSYAEKYLAAPNPNLLEEMSSALQ